MSNIRHIRESVERALRDLIAERFPPGSQLPSERELAELLGASRAALREIVGSMCRAGELESKWGVGTFVSVRSRPLVHALDGSGGIRQEAIEQGFRPELQIFSVELIECPEDVATSLGIEPATAVWRTSRLLYLDGHPVAHLTDYVRSSIDGRSIDLSGFGKDSQLDIIALVREQCGFDTSRFEATVEAVAADAEVARRLGLPTGVPLIHFTRYAQSPGGLKITRVEIRYAPGRVALRISGGGLS